MTSKDVLNFHIKGIPYRELLKSDDTKSRQRIADIMNEENQMLKDIPEVLEVEIGILGKIGVVQIDVIYMNEWLEQFTDKKRRLLEKAHYINKELSSCIQSMIEG